MHTHTFLSAGEKLKANRVDCASKTCFTNASPFVHTTQDPAHLQMHFCHHFPSFNPPKKCLTSLPLPASLILLRKLYYVVSEIANLVEKQWGWKLMCASSLQCLADYLQMGAEVSPGMPCMWLNLWMPPNLHLCGFKSAYQPWCQQVSLFGLKFNWEAVVLSHAVNDWCSGVWGFGEGWIWNVWLSAPVSLRIG